MTNEEQHTVQEIAYQAHIDERIDRMKEANTAPANKCKFRISVSKEQLDFILSCPDCPADLRKIIELQLFKIQGGMATPAYEIRQLQPKRAADLKPEQAYKMACSHLEMGKEIPAHLQAGYSQYRYENDLMAEEEQAQYEHEALGV